MTILNLNFYLFVLIGQKIIVADLRMGISPHNFVLYKYKSMQVLTGKQMGLHIKHWFMRDISRTA